MGIFFPTMSYLTQKKKKKWKWKLLSHVLLFPTPWTIQSMEFSRPEYWSGWPFPSPGDLPNPGLPHCRRILYQLSQQRSLRILEWAAYPISSGSPRPRNQTRVSFIAGVFFISWAIRGDHLTQKMCFIFGFLKLKLLNCISNNRYEHCSFHLTKQNYTPSWNDYHNKFGEHASCHPCR